MYSLAVENNKLMNEERDLEDIINSFIITLLFFIFIMINKIVFKIMKELFF